MADQPAEHATSEYVFLDAGQIERLATLGTERATQAGDVLFQAGAENTAFFVVLGGMVDILGSGADGPVLITSHVAGQFLGELNLLIGQRPFVSAVVREPGRVLMIDLEVFGEIVRTMPDIADVIFREFVHRRTNMESGSGAQAIQIIGTRFSARSTALRVFASRSQIPHTWIDLDDVEDAGVLLASLGAKPSSVPVVVTPVATLANPTAAEFAKLLGLSYRQPAGEVHDVTVVGLGPAGLAAAVVAAAEGLDAVCLDAVAVGGQAAASSRIENYLGFPNGISGVELIEAGAVQAQRLGSRLVSPSPVVGLRTVDDHKVVTLADGSELTSRAVVIASGARYRKLEVPDLERFEGAGVYYATTDIELRACRDQHVIVVGGGNSAGQAALSLAKCCTSVSLVVRRGDLASTMSQYLVARVEADPRIRLLTQCVVDDLRGTDSVQEAVIRHVDTGEVETVPCRGVFSFIGAEPATDWLGDDIARDRSGFILTDRDLPEPALAAAGFTHREPLAFETSVPGVFAVGDVRSSSLKRVAAAVGEGSTVMRSVVAYLGPRD